MGARGSAVGLGTALQVRRCEGCCSLAYVIKLFQLQVSDIVKYDNQLDNNEKEGGGVAFIIGCERLSGRLKSLSKF
jgi:hypothetical protein